MFTCKSLIVSIVAVCLIAAARGADAPPAKGLAQPRGGVRIGVYDSRAIAIAAVRSSGVGDEMKAMMKEAADAKAAGDEARVARLAARGKAKQLLLHLQGFSNAPVDEYLDKHREALPGIARAAGVIAILPKADYHDPAVEVVDVTEALLELFAPKDQSQQMAQELRKHGPVKMIEILENPDAF
jgi:hypothetical protein